MGAFGVVVGGEFVELSLKVGDGFGGWLGVDPAFECLVEVKCPGFSSDHF